MPAGSDDQAGAGATRRQMFSELVRLETELWNAVDARVRRDHGQPLSTFEFLRLISRRSQCRVHDIAAELSITVGGTSKIVDRLAAGGCCLRRANPGDARSSLIELTEAGRQLLTGMTASVDDELRTRLGESFPERALSQFTGTLTRLRAAVQSADAPPR